METRRSKETRRYLAALWLTFDAPAGNLRDTLNSSFRKHPLREELSIAVCFSQFAGNSASNDDGRRL